MRAASLLGVLCSNCGEEYAIAKGRCRPCYVYWWRRGKERSLPLLSEAAQAERNYRRWVREVERGLG